MRLAAVSRTKRELLAARSFKSPGRSGVVYSGDVGRDFGLTGRPRLEPCGVYLLTISWFEVRRLDDCGDAACSSAVDR